MDADSPVKDILYKELSKISENKILLEISKKNSSKVISEIISKCSPKIKQITRNLEEDLGNLAESLMHYFLTLALIPSQRKVSEKNLEIDIVIPDLRTLQHDPKDALVILFPKTADTSLIKKCITDIEKIQPFKENIWLVMNKILEFSNKTYQINSDTGSVSKILDDIDEFFSNKKQTRFKIMKS